MSTNFYKSFIITTILILMTKQSITEDLMTQQQQYYQQFNTDSNNNKLNSINNKVDENLLNQYNNLLKHELKTNQANTHYKQNVIALKLPQQLQQQKHEKKSKNKKKTEYQKKDDIVIVTETIRNDYYHTINDTHDSDIIKYAFNNNDSNNNNNNNSNKIYDTHSMYKKKSILRENKRQRRELSDWLIAPHTRWCGRGNLANGTYSHLGGASKADKCCRRHDHCHSYIPGMSTRYELFNFRPYTLSHCKCDRRFRTCLKLAIDEDANAIGKLFFNMVQTKCFIVQSEKICQKRAADGSCEIEAVKKKAHLRNNRKY